MNSVSRDVLRAVLETRDHRHHETHAVLVAMFQGLAAELVEQGVLAPVALAARLELAGSAIAPDPHGSVARDVLDHVTTWLRRIDTDMPVPHPERWIAEAAAET